MAVLYNTPVKNARLSAVVAAIDAGATNGTFELLATDNTTVLASVTLAKPSGTVSQGVLTFSGLPLSDSSADATGTAGYGRVKDSNGTVVLSGLTAGTASTDVILNTTAITLGQIFTINSVQITHG